MFAEQAAAQLNLLREQIERLTIDDTACRKLADEAFQCPQLQPRTEPIYRGRLFTVSRAAPAATADAAPQHHGVTGLADALREFMLALNRAKEIHAKLKIVSVDTSVAGRAMAKTLIHVSGEAEDGPLEINAVWRCTWNVQRAPPRLNSIRVQDFEQVVCHTPGGKLFSDCTAAVLGKTRAWNDQLVRGVDHWRRRHEQTLAPYLTGLTGVAIGDVNSDDLEDVYLCYGNGLPNRLLLQNADGTVRDASRNAGVDWLDACASALLLDLDNDGDQDLAVGTGLAVLLHENDGTGSFTLRATVAFPSVALSMAAADYDEDGRLDLYICGHTPAGEEQAESLLGFPVPIHDANNGAANALLRNDGDWAFSNVTEVVGLGENNRRFSYACGWEDFDNDGDQDLYVANDFGRNNLYKNHAGNFTDVAAKLGVEDISSGMSVSWADYNRDGRMDLYIGNMYSGAGNRITYQRQFEGGKSDDAIAHLRRHARGNSLFASSSTDGFEDVSLAARVNFGRWAWSSKFVDIDNNGRHDLVVANGFVTGQLPDDL